MSLQIHHTGTVTGSGCRLPCASGHKTSCPDGPSHRRRRPRKAAATSLLECARSIEREVAHSISITPRSPSETVPNRKLNACPIKGTSERLFLGWRAWYAASRAFTPKYVSCKVSSSLDSPRKSFTNPFDPGARFSTTVHITPNKWFMFSPTVFITATYGSDQSQRWLTSAT